MANKYIELIEQAYKNGVLNDFMAKKLLNVVDSGITEDLYSEISQDAQDASDAGVITDDDYNAYFFVIRFTDDLLNDTFGIKISPNEKKDLCHYIISHKHDDKNYKLDNLIDYRLLTHKWLCDRLSKKAYPNIAGKDIREPIQDLDKWIETLKNIYRAIHDKKIDRRSAIDYFTTEWDPDEKYKFINWMKYYEDGTTEKYNVKTAKFIKEALGPDGLIPQSWFNREDRASDGMNLSTTKREETRREKELDRARQYKVQMKGRLRAFKKLLERYNDILPKQDLDRVYEELYSLEKSVNKLDVYASIQDCIVRSANRVHKIGFYEGAEFLHKIAVEPEGLQSPQQVGTNSPDLLNNTNQAANVQVPISRLESISKELKTRNMIRELANIDILLNEMGLASYFPELTDAQAKMIEAFGYASNKIEGIIAKLRGGGKTSKQESLSPSIPTPQAPTPAPVKPAEPIDTGELMAKPVGELQKKLPPG